MRGDNYTPCPRFCFKINRSGGRGYSHPLSSIWVLLVETIGLKQTRFVYIWEGQSSHQPSKEDKCEMDLNFYLEKANVSKQPRFFISLSLFISLTINYYCLNNNNNNNNNINNNNNVKINQYSISYVLGGIPSPPSVITVCSKSCSQMNVPCGVALFSGGGGILWKYWAFKVPIDLFFV